MTLITVTRKLQVNALLDIKNPDFAQQYELGVWWAMFGDEQAKGLYPDTYLIENVAHGIAKGWYSDLETGHFHHIGFYLGMIHGGLLVSKSQKPAHLVILTNPDFEQGYLLGSKDYADLNDDWLIKLFHQWARDCPPYQILAYELGKLICRLSLALTHRILLEMAPEAVTSR